MIPTLKDLDLKGKRIFVRVDFNVPLSDGRITETHRIDATLPTLRTLQSQAAKIVLASHLGRPGGKREAKWSLAPVRAYLEQALSMPVAMAPDCTGPEVEALVKDNSQPTVILLENLRFNPGEEANDTDFSHALAALAEVYVNDAFGTAHRAHASTAGMVPYVPRKGMGLLFQKEMECLGRALSSPERPFVAILGGAKVSDKMGVIRNLMDKVNTLIIGGGMAYTFLKARGRTVGKSLLEEDRLHLAMELINLANDHNVRLHLPTDHVAAQTAESMSGTVISDENIPSQLMGLDIGPRSTDTFAQEIRNAGTVIWNGPVGLFEKEPFSHGTCALAKALAESNAISIIGGGDTVAAVGQAGVAEKMTHLSTGGGATLEFLEGKKLPGVVALENNQ